MDRPSGSIDDGMNNGKAYANTFINPAFLGSKKRLKYLAEMVRVLSPPPSSVTSMPIQPVRALSIICSYLDDSTAAVHGLDGVNDDIMDDLMAFNRARQ